METGTEAVSLLCHQQCKLSGVRNISAEQGMVPNCCYISENYATLAR
jgi:hypothetical protein